MGKRRPRNFAQNRTMDADHFGGATVLGEPLHLLFSAMSRFEFSRGPAGRMNVSFDSPADEGRALVRAMERAERPFRGDERTPGERDFDRLMAVVERVMETATAIASARALASFRADLPHRDSRRLG